MRDATFTRRARRHRSVDGSCVRSIISSAVRQTKRNCCAQQLVQRISGSFYERVALVEQNFSFATATVWVGSIDLYRIFLANSLCCHLLGAEIRSLGCKNVDAPSHDSLLYCELVQCAIYWELEES
jgi:hypothetical protein